MAHPRGGAGAWEMPGWKTAVSAIAAVIVAILFLVSGVWKITDPFNWAAVVTRLKVPANLSLIGACLLGVAETAGGVLVLVPRFRRWGAALIALLLVFFMGYIGFYYEGLRGEECNCFPLLKRVVGPGFFIGDGVMLALAVVAGWWGRRSHDLRGAALVVLAVAVFAGVSLGANARRQSLVPAPASIEVEGKPVALREGNYFIFFFDPECTHCDAAARMLAKMQWKPAVQIIAVPIEQPQFAKDFMRDTGLRGSISNDVTTLRRAFSFVTAPYAVAVEGGHQQAVFVQFDPEATRANLKRVGFVQ